MSPEQRRARLARARRLFLAFLTLALSAQLWPVIDRVPSIEPRIGGIPFGLVWVVGWVVALFLGLLVLHLYEVRMTSGDEDATP